MRRHLQKANKKVPYVDSDISTHKRVDQADEDTNEEDNVGKPATAALEVRTFQSDKQ